jgi:hypothetical protein
MQVIEAPTDDENWEELGWICVDSATVAFGAASVLGEDFRVEPEAGIRNGSARGYEAVLVLQGTRVNADRKGERAPVENGSTLSLKLLGDLRLVHRLAA